ncbi:glycosyltransferase [Schleiferia thermophila]|jgi:glycosyltransferase involved in cell wall biosynthesis|uniref:Glycosyltransferase involved in cell wall biosynthesis n=1 Tax=Schleiferia thermophila TaxID=884107 RepID=A0A369A4G4_9FLAO|nr:glycosyltransferase [Schleiferia thermophila]KFD38998.1 glycosyl transferase family 1 [Schleiferia thermophila str. Yellowstone]RCX02344.1 glycosyltransferase involved in cell wall biosynthesis [Schleiferia thermophila]GCD80772.1 glycosyl transferase family 1 [Schleiferia thermophila]
MTKNDTRRILIITYYWPPSGGIAVQRWLRFTGHLKTLGWIPVVYTPENPEVLYEDSSTEKLIPEGIEILKRKIVEPHSFFRWITGQDRKKTGFGFAQGGQRRSFVSELGIWIRGNLFIPDARTFWIKPSINFLTKYLKEKPVDILITTGPPHSMHLIGMGVKKRTNIPWIADFRDPWTNIDFYKELKLTKISDFIHRKLEKKVLTHADAILVVSEQMKREFSEITHKPIHVITNGFDGEDFEEIQVEPEDKFLITHVGTLPPSRNPIILWKILKKLCECSGEFSAHLKIRLVGKVDQSILESIETYGLENYLEHIPFVERKTALKYQKLSQINLLVVNNTPNAAGILTGKLYEYMAAGRFILAIGPEGGDLDTILREINMGTTIGFEAYEKGLHQIETLYQLFKENRLQPSVQNTEKYSRQNLAKEISKIIKNTIYKCKIS